MAQDLGKCFVCIHLASPNLILGGAGVPDLVLRCTSYARAIPRSPSVIPVPLRSGVALWAFTQRRGGAPQRTWSVCGLVCRTPPYLANQRNWKVIDITLAGKGQWIGWE